jgi:FtsZ-binding cell division protein ZapB
LDEESILQEFSRLEERIETLVAAVTVLKGENAELKDRVSALLADLDGKTARERRFLEERELVRSRIDSLLAKLSEPAGAPGDE